MGSAVAARFVAAGYATFVFDIEPDRVAKAAAGGAQTVRSPRELADTASVVISCLPDGAASRQVISGSDGLSSGRAMRFFVETATLGPTNALNSAQVLSGAGVDYIDSPVSGHPKAIQDGTLTAIVAAPESARSLITPILQVFCGRIFHVGEKPGLGQACKLVNNLLSLSIMALASEACVYGVMAGLDAEVMIKVINSCTGRSGVTEDKFPAAILNRTFAYGGAMASGAKDVALFVKEANSLGAHLELSPAVAELWEKVTNQGNPRRDFTQFIQYFENLSGVVVGASALHT
jgi:3-hydroxyisobutyrate dehydrogenase-like beta-hydroxyacid dehydrogenase